MLAKSRLYLFFSALTLLFCLQLYIKPWWWQRIPSAYPPPNTNSQDDFASSNTPALLTTPNHHHRTELFSNMTTDGKYFLIDFGVNFPTSNPNLLPHQDQPDTWIVVAQREKSQDRDQTNFLEYICDAKFMDGKMQCVSSPRTLPVAPTSSTKCIDELGYVGLSVGPHDARVFHGPDQPYIIYGSQSQYSCLGQWIHSLQHLTDWQGVSSLTAKFSSPTDMRRPFEHSKVEKNWFAFWDSNDEMYIHYDIFPKRVYAKLSSEGVAGKDLATLGERRDKICMDKYIPQALGESAIHQATNSLSITLCKRSDLQCQKTSENTYIFTIFQHKSYKDGHPVYEPRVMVFRQKATFEIYGISSKPFWVSGRGEIGGSWTEGTSLPKDQSQMLYMTSMSWKRRGLTYHGYLDDEIFIGFGVEDRTAGAIDVFAEDLLGDLGLC